MTTDKPTSTTSDCPPADALAAEGEVFRCCKHNTPSADDLRTNEESGRLGNADACRRRALSVLRTQEDAEHQVQLFKRWKKKFVLKATLSVEHGCTKLTTGDRPTHTSWWPAGTLAAEARAALFTCVVEVEQ